MKFFKVNKYKNPFYILGYTEAFHTTPCVQMWESSQLNSC